MEDRAQIVYTYLNDLGINFLKHEHPAVYTVAEANEHRDDITGMHCKNLFMRDKKGRQHFLIVVESSKQVDIKALNQLLGERLSFASPERLLKYLGLEPGSVSPFGLIQDEDTIVKLLLDQDIQNAKEVNFHPNINTVTLTLRKEDFVRYVQAVGNQWQFIEI